MRVALYTLGCKVNSYETDKIRETFQSEGVVIVPFTELADVYIVNTCTVTQMAAKKSRQILHRARRLNPRSIDCRNRLLCPGGRREDARGGCGSLYKQHGQASVSTDGE